MSDRIGIVQGLSPDSAYNLQIDAGAFFEGVALPGGKATAQDVYKLLIEAKKEGRCLGATTGGGNFSAVPEQRQVDMDGMRYPIIGSTVFDSWNVAMTTTMKEVTRENWKRVLATSEEDPVTGAIRIRTRLGHEDYIEKLCWAGNRNDGALVFIELDNALNISGANFTFTDKGEGTIPVEFRAHVSDLENMDYAPCRIFIFEGAEAPDPINP